MFEPIVNQTANMMMKARDCVFPRHPGPPALMAKVHSDVHQICFPDDDDDEEEEEEEWTDEMDEEEQSDDAMDEDV